MTIQEKRHAVIYQIQEVLGQKSKSFTFKRKRLLLYTSAKSGPPRVKNTVPWLPLDWTLLSGKTLPNKNYIVRKLNTNKSQILHRIRPRKYNPEEPPEDNYQETQWQVDDNIVVPQNDLYTIAWEAEFGGHLFDIPIIYTDPNANDFDDSHTQGPDTVIVPRSYFHDSSNGQNRQTCPFLTHLYHKLQSLN